MRRLIRTDGSFVDLTQPVSMKAAHDMINAGTLDTVILRHMGLPLHVMLVDDLAYETEQIDHGNGIFENRCVRALKPVNHEATRLYHLNCVAGVTHEIVGDVLVVPDEDYA